MQYLEWAIRTYPLARWDLGTSGVAAVSLEELGGPVDLKDAGSWMRFREAIAQRYGVAPEEVMPALGGHGALWVAAVAALGFGEGAVVEAPSYEPVCRLAE